jgi:hypothetical protein
MAWVFWGIIRIGSMNGASVMMRGEYEGEGRWLWGYGAGREGIGREE